MVNAEIERKLDMTKPENRRISIKPTTPKIGDYWIEVYPEKTGGWTSHIRIYKENTLRGDIYWVTEAFYTYAKENDARKFASRFIVVDKAD